MRTVTLNISKLGLVITNTINLQLVDSVGNIYVSPSGYALDEDIVLDNAVFSKELPISSEMLIISYYKLTLPNSLYFNFQVPSTSLYDAPHDLLSLLSIGCVDGIIDKHEKKLEADFVEKLELYFTGENPHFSAVQKDVVNLFEYYADEIKDGDSTIDIMQMMDEYLATITGVQ